MDPARNVPPLLRLPAHLRHIIYVYLLGPHPGSITTINYDLEWPYLDHPSSTTFTAHQLDHCKCPRQGPDDPPTSPAGSHVYTRYICKGPDVRFSPKSGKQWVLLQPGPAFNILRPASEEELEERPNAGILRANKLIYYEALPILYRDRNFLLLTSICSRGRYQAYATQVWLSRMSSLARASTTTLSLLIQPNEEDCQNSNSLQAFQSLSQYILNSLPRFQHLCLNLWPSEVSPYPFVSLFLKQGANLHVQLLGGDLKVFDDAWSYLEHCGGPEDQVLSLRSWLLSFKRVEPDIVLSDSMHLRP